MGRFTTPGAQVESFVFTTAAGQRYAPTLTDSLSVSKSRTMRKRIEDAHTARSKYQLEHKPGEFTCTFVTDQDLSWVDSIEDATAICTLLNGRILRFTGVTFATEDGLEENTTEGKTNELTFSFETDDDRDS